MASLVVNKQYSDPLPPAASQLDAAFNSIENFVNVIGFGSDNIAANSISTQKLQDGAVTETKIASDAVTGTEIANEAITLEKFAADLARYFEPIGTIDAYAGDTAPLGYLICDGSAADRVVNAKLFAITGIRYGVGDGVSTFNLPDLRGYFLRGVDGSAGRAPENASRTAMNTGGNVGDLPGSVQLDDWKYPEGRSGATQAFSIVAPQSNRTGTLLGVDKTSGTGAGAYGGPGNGYDPSLAGIPGLQTPQLQNINSATKLGLESRPKNVSTIFIIKT